MINHLQAYLAKHPTRLYTVLRAKPHLEHEFYTEELRLGRDMTVEEKLHFAQLDFITAPR
jgi:hypothetical protein